MTSDPLVIEGRARRAYERARWSRAASACTPFFVVVAIAALMGHRPTLAAVLGLGLYLSGVVLHWRGQQLGAGLLPGAVAGLIPLSFALCAKTVGHVCTGTMCVSLCVPACFTGGILAGLSLTVVASRRGAGVAFWLASTGIAALTGALGCSCMGFGGVAGLVVGLAIPTAAGLAQTVRAARP